MTTNAGLVAHQIRLEQLAFWRNPQSAFFTFALPLALLLGLGASSGDEPKLLVPGILAFGVVGASYSNLAANVTSLRTDGVLKRIRATPLPAHLYLGSLIGSVLISAILIAGAVLAAGHLAFDVTPTPDRLPGLILTFALGLICFAALGLAVSAVIPSGDAAVPVTNGTFLPVALLSGVFDPSQALPHWLSTVMSWLPVRPLVHALRAGFDPTAGPVQTRDLGVLAAWALIGAALAYKTFRWQR